MSDIISESSDWSRDEYSHYSSEIKSLTELPELQENLTLKKLRVMHCSRLESMQGIEHLSQLRELNLSSNSILRIEGLHEMSQLRILNLSCNNIRVINGLSGLINLEKLNLSFNKISSLSNLKQLYGQRYRNFTTLDLRGNNITQLTELNYLKDCTYLLDVALEGTSGTNPVCKLLHYHYTLLNSLSNAQFIDQQPVSNLRKTVKNIDTENSPPSRSISPPRKISPQRKSSPPIRVSSERRTQEPFLAPTQPEIIPAAESSNQVLKEMKHEIIRLQKENERLYGESKEMCNRYEMNDKYWSERFKRVEQDCMDTVKQARDIEQDKKRIHKELLLKHKQCEEYREELQKVKEARDSKDSQLAELNRQVASMMKDLGETQRNATHYMDELHRYQEKIKLLDITNTELRSQLKQSEQTLSCLHAKTLDNSTQALHKYDELQRKYEDSINRLNEKEREIESLRDKNRELLDMNSKFDENWSDKFKEAIRNKDYIIEQLQREINEAAFREKEKAQSVLFQNKEEMKDRIYEIEQAYNSKLEEIKNNQREAERQAEDTKREIADLKELLRMSIEKEGRAKGLIQELTALIKQLQEQLDKEITEKMLMKTQYEDSITDLKQELNIYKSRSDKLTQRLQNIEQDMNLGEDTLYQKNREINKLKRELTEAGEQIDSARDSIKQLKIKLEKSETYYEQDIERLEAQIKELELTLGTKNTIIDDQNESIRELKNLIKQLEREIDASKSSKTNYKDQYETKLQDAYDEIEKLKEQGVKNDQYISDLETQLDEIAEKRDRDKKTISELERQIHDKSEILAYIEDEVKLLQNEKNSKRMKEAEEKDRIIEDLKGFRDELNASLIQKERELADKSMKIRELEGFIEQLSWELNSSKEKIRGMEQELKVVLTEMDRQKREAQNKISQLQQLFSI